MQKFEMLKAGSIARVHVNQHLVRANQQDGGSQPVFTVERRGKTYRCHDVSIKGHSCLIYSPDKPLLCGARVWIETKSPVEISYCHNETEKTQESLSN